MTVINRVPEVVFKTRVRDESVDGPNVTLNVNDVGADEQLVAWAMDKTIGVRPNNAGRVLMQFHGFVDIV